MKESVPVEDDLLDYANKNKLTPDEFQSYLESKNVKYKATDEDSDEINFEVWVKPAAYGYSPDWSNFTYNKRKKVWVPPYAIRPQAGQTIDRLLGRR